MPCGKDADEYIAAIAAANTAAIVPLETNETLAHEAMKEWIALQNPVPDDMDWIKHQVYLKTFLERKKIARTRYRAREWKLLSATAFDTIKATQSALVTTPSA